MNERAREGLRDRVRGREREREREREIERQGATVVRVSKEIFHASGLLYKCGV